MVSFADEAYPIFISSTLYNDTGHSQAKSTWIADSGCNQLVTNDRSDFFLGTTHTANDAISVGSGAMTCKLRGLVVLETRYGLLAFPDALYLPDCGRKLIPESILDKLDLAVNKPGDGTITVTDAKSKAMLMTGRMSSGLYQFDDVIVHQQLTLPNTLMAMLEKSNTDSSKVVLLIDSRNKKHPFKIFIFAVRVFSLFFYPSIKMKAFCCFSFCST